MSIPPLLRPLSLLLALTAWTPGEAYGQRKNPELDRARVPLGGPQVVDEQLEEQA